jgi:predicted patatin/cPLA2 family phospholipase
MGNSCIVLEGGGLRGAFTGGVLEYLLEKDFDFDRIVGVSAGACLGASYVSGQKGRNLKVNVEYPSDPRYMGFRHLLTKGSYFNMDFIFGEIPDRLVPFDEQAFYSNPAEFDVVTTSLDSGESVVFDKKEMRQWGVDRVLVASSSIPLISQPVDIGGQPYFDGGVADPIPVRYALERHEKTVVVLTRPRGYRKGKSGNMLLFRLLFRKHPAFIQAMLRRNEAYDRTLDFIGQMERNGRLFVLAPSVGFSIGRTEKRYEKRLALYQHGYRLMEEEFKNLWKFLDKE